MTTKPFEVQGDRIVINGFELQVDQNGSLTVGGTPVAEGLVGVSSRENPSANSGEAIFKLGLNANDQNFDDISLYVYKSSSGGNPGISLGYFSNNTSIHSDGVLAIGNDDVGFNSKSGGIYIGYQAGWNNLELPQGENSIAIGAKAAYQFTPDNSITLNATGLELNPDQSGLFIKPIRQEIYSSYTVYYNPTSGEVTYAATTSPPVTYSSRAMTTDTALGLTDGETRNLDLSGYKGYILYKIETSHAAWVRIYTNDASRIADITRIQSQDPLPGAGVVAEAITTGAQTVLITPGAIGFNDEDTPVAAIPISVTNLSGNTEDIVVTLTILQTES